jgi:dihydrofolate synthase/folylpolyglutamate synthase
MLQDKDIYHSLEPLIPIVSQWFCLSINQTPRGANYQELLDILQKLQVTSALGFTEINEALSAAFQQCNANDIVVIFGSFYTISAALAVIDPIEGSKHE